MITRRLFLALPLLATPAFAANRRIVVLGGSLAEIVAALGAEGELVGRDTTSTFPPSLLALPDVGYVRALSPEGVLSLTPDLILAEPDAGPPPVIEVLRAAGTQFVTIPGAPTAAGVVAKIEATAAALGLPEQGAALAARVAAEIATAQALPAPNPLRVLFVLSLQGGAVMAGGEGSSAEGIIHMAGGVNVGLGFDGFKPMTDEAVLAADPQAILVMDREGQQSITPQMIAAHPALGRTTAATEGRIVAMDGMLLLGFGPRTGQAATALHQALYGDAG
jgi:iron complex transport system substrate-binding protein